MHRDDTTFMKKECDAIKKEHSEDINVLLEIKKKNCASRNTKLNRRRRLKRKISPGQVAQLVRNTLELLKIIL